jgi:hypothetical protein
MSSIHISPTLLHWDSFHPSFCVFLKTYLHRWEECQASVPARKKYMALNIYSNIYILSFRLSWYAYLASSCETLAKLLVSLQCGVSFSVRIRFM